jgi:arylsulfatase A-like enzyme
MVSFISLPRLLVPRLLIVAALFVLSGGAAQPPPNFVIIFADDLGYGDIGCFGATEIKTPRIDRMAEEGMRFTNFYAQTVCGPSRAALMTGSYPLRVATHQNQVEIHPSLHLEEVTIAEVLREVGYTSAAFGKWDLAKHNQNKFHPELLPLYQGFDYFFGTPTSNDSTVNLIRNNEVIEEDTDMSLLTRRYTDEAIAFIQRSKDRPFFVYLAHTMPHVELAVSDAFRGKSAGGLYGDVVEEIDFNVGRLLDALQAEGLDEHTYVIFTSDNGPWFLGRSAGHLKRIGPDAVTHGGSSGPLRGAKTSTWEGGLRVPFVIRAPGRVPAGTVCDEVAATLDMLPTLAGMAGGKPPQGRVIDGHDIRELIAGVSGAKTPTKAFYYYAHTRLQAVRMGPWKLQLPRPVNPAWDRYSEEEDVITSSSPLLFDLASDVGETIDVAAAHPAIVAEMVELAEWARRDIGDYDRAGTNARFFDPEPHRPDIGEPK